MREREKACAWRELEEARPGLLEIAYLGLLEEEARPGGPGGGGGALTLVVHGMVVMGTRREMGIGHWPERRRSERGVRFPISRRHNNWTLAMCV